MTGEEEMMKLVKLTIMLVLPLYGHKARWELPMPNVGATGVYAIWLLRATGAAKW
jgi:hypothetical protein